MMKLIDCVFSGVRFRLRGDWSDTGPNARPEAEGRGGGESGDAGEGSGGAGAEAEAAEEGEGPREGEQQRQPAQDLQVIPELFGPPAVVQGDENTSGLALNLDSANRVETPAQANLMQRMTDALSRMLNDPSTRNAMRNLQAYRCSRAYPEIC